MLIVRKNQLFDQEWQVCQYINGEFIGIVSGMGRNAGTLDSAAKSKRTAQRWRSNAGGMIRRVHITLKL